VSGLLGLGWQSIASSRATPFWQTLVSAGAWAEPVMTFQLTRYVSSSMHLARGLTSLYVCRYVNVTDVQKEEAGGSFTMGKHVRITVFWGQSS
jgi:cathepsin D